MFVSETISSAIIEKVTAELEVYPIELIEKLHQFQWRKTLEATRKYNSIEVSDLLRLDIKALIVNKNLEKLKLLLEKYSSMEGKEKEISRLKDKIEYLNTKKR